MDIEWTKYLEREFSRALRYSYPGFLILFLSAVINLDYTIAKISAVHWLLILIAALAIGAGLYSVHRALIIPFHYSILIFLLWVWDTWRPHKISREDSTSPTRWFHFLGVARCRRMLAYLSLRRSNKFLEESERKQLNIAHAENGLIVMTSEGFLLSAWFISCNPAWDKNGIGWFPFLILGFVLWGGSYLMAAEQHKLECMNWRRKEQRYGSVKKALIESGILDSNDFTTS